MAPRRGRIVLKLLAEGDVFTASYYVPYERFGPMSPVTAGRLVRIERYYYVCLTGLALVGFTMAVRCRDRTLAALFAASLVVGHWITFVFPRHRVPFIPFLAVFAAATLCRPFAVWQPTRTRTVVATTVVALFALAVWWS